MIWFFVREKLGFAVLFSLGYVSYFLDGGLFRVYRSFCSIGSAYTTGTYFKFWLFCGSLSASIDVIVETKK